MTDDAVTSPTLTVVSRRRRWRRRAVRLILAGFVLAVVLTAASVGWIRARADGHVYSVDQVPAAPVALVLGAFVNDDGTPSAFLEARLALAKRLYDDGKVRAVLVSGDHGRWTYNEPDVMREWLVAHGLPADRVVADYAGFDTYDSCQRATHVFGVDRLIVITQSYHIARAVALCRDAGIEADGVADDTVRQYTGFWTKAVVREQGACLKAAFDVLSGRDPVFLGQHETGIEDALGN